jgi:hypothetical protein
MRARHARKGPLGQRRFLARCFLLLLCLISKGAIAEEWQDSIVNEYGPAVVRIETFHRRRDGTKQFAVAAGSGFVVTASGLIVTAAHVVRDVPDQQKTELRRSVDVYFRGEGAHPYPASVLPGSVDLDVAVLQIEPPAGLRSVIFGRSRGFAENDFVMYIGWPGGQRTNNAGRATNVSLVRPDLGPSKNGLWLVEMASGVGASGAPVFNRCGQVIGLVLAGPDYLFPSKTYVLPEHIAHHFLDHKVLYDQSVCLGSPPSIFEGKNSGGSYSSILTFPVSPDGLLWGCPQYRWMSCSRRDRTAQ